MTRISFLMPTYNRGHLIAESIRSILGQMGAQDELLVIDDGSTDGTAAAVGAFASRVRYHRQENAGKSVALNRGLAMTDGAFVWICDDDDLMRPGAIGLLVDEIERTGADLVFGRYTRFQEKDGVRVDLGTGYWPDLATGSLPRHILEDAFVMHNATIARRSAYEQVGPFDETMLRSQDYEMFVRLATQVRLAYVDALVFDQRKHEGARGPARVLHGAGRSDEIWKRYDRRIFERVRRELPLAYFEAMFSSDRPEVVRRAALLQRASIMARHDMVAEAIDDLEAAAAVAPAVPLLSGEREVCRRIAAGKHGFAGLLEPANAARARRLYRGSGAGRTIVSELVTGVFWRLRYPDWHVRRETFDLLCKAVGSPQLPVLMWRQMRQSGARPDPIRFEEVREPAPFVPAAHRRTA